MNLTKFFKSGLASVLVLVIGLAVLLGFGFNRGFDFTGGTVIQVNSTTIVVEDATRKINTVLSEYNNIEVYAVTHHTVEDENSDDTYFTIKYQVYNNVGATNSAILEDLYTTFGYNSADSVQSNYIIMTDNLDGAYGTEVFVNAFLAVLVALVACGLYVFARFNLTTAIAMIAQAIVDIGIMLSIVAIARIQITGLIGVAIIATAFISIMFGFVMLNTLNRLATEANNAKKSNQEIAKLAFAEQSKHIFVFGLTIIVATLLLSFICGDMANSTLIATAFGVLSVIFSSLYITPALWALAYTRHIKQPKISNPTEEVEETEILWKL